jgi:peptidoglycan/LPS O-acetylase OafA/YrhL
VVLTHLGLFLPGSLDGSEAVVGFFVLSGYYIHLAVTEPYRGRPGAFYLNRALRLWPAYVCTALAALALALWSYARDGVTTTILVHALVYQKHLSLAAWAAVLSTDFFILGHDWLVFCKVNFDGSLGFSPAAYLQDNCMATHCLLPQCWSLGLELGLYALAWPLFKRGPKALLALALLSLAAKWCAQEFLTSTGPWYNRFVLFELGGFLAGAVAHAWRGALARHGFLLWMALAWVLGARFLPLDSPSIQCLSVPLLALGCPALAQATESKGWDRALGQWSYPLYLAHWPAYLLAAMLVPGAGRPALLAAAFPCVALSTALLVFLVERPMEALRRRVREA